jgi:hypothetical protein
MKTMTNLACAASALLLAVSQAKAQTSFTVTGWAAGVPVPGIVCTNAAGQSYLKGNVHVVRVQGSQPALTGRLTAWMDVAYQADGKGLLAGPLTLKPAHGTVTARPSPQMAECG